jgi:DNA-binding MarR family transcriptional regulator
VPSIQIQAKRIGLLGSKQILFGISLSKKPDITNIFYDLREVRIVNSFKLKPVHKLVLFILEARGDKIYPSKSTIAKECGYSKATINKAIKELENADLLHIKRQFNSSNWYYLNERLFHEEANRLRQEERLRKNKMDEHKDLSYDPWNDNSTPELENDIEFADLEIDEITRIRNEQALSNMWDSLNSVSSQS